MDYINKNIFKQTKLRIWLLLLMPAFFSLNSYSANCNISWASTSASVTTELALSSYTLTSNTICGGGGGIGSSGIPIGNLVTINFPAGTNASTITTGTFNGSAISFILLNPTQITFNAPVNAAKGTSCVVVLNNVTNPSAATYTTLVLSAVNNSSGTTSFSNSNYTITPLPPMVYSSSTTTQGNTSNVITATTQNEVIGIEIVTTGIASPIDATSFTFNTTGTTSPATDITNAKLWYSGTSNSFSTATQVGGTVVGINGVFVINGTQTLAIGTNYFWLTYDVPPTAAIGNFIDAECTSITVNAVPQTPSITTPAGNREITIISIFLKIYEIGDVNSHIMQTSDGGYIIGNSDGTAPFGGASDGYLHKLSSSGVTQWVKNIGTTSYEECQDVLQTADGGYAVLLFANETAGWWRLVKTDANGNILWSQSYDLGGGGISHSMQETSDGGFILAGRTPAPDMFIVKTNSLGVEQWNNRFQYSGVETIYSIEQTTDGGYIFVGDTDNGGEHVVVTKTDGTGAMIWAKKYNLGAVATQLSWSIRQTLDLGYAMVGYINAGPIGSSDAFLLKINPIGVVEWAKAYGSTSQDHFTALELLPDGGFVMNGMTDGFGTSARHMMVIRTDSQGNLNWGRIYGDNADPYSGGYGIIKTIDEGLAFIGARNWSEQVLIKTNIEGYIDCNTSTITPTVINIVVATTDISPSITETSIVYNWNVTTLEQSQTPTVNILCQQVVLPIELVSFSGKNIGNYNLLQWETSTEINNDFFTIERSLDAMNFEPINTISGAGNSNTILSYSTSDDHPYPLTYYRLKQTDFDGKFEYSKIISISKEDFSQINIYPNPFENNFVIQLPIEFSYPLNIEIIDYLGKKVFSKLINDETEHVEISLNNQFSTGTYFLKIFNNKEYLVKKLIKLK